MMMARLAIEGTLAVDFRRQAASALMHPATLVALGTLLANDLLFKALWPGAWAPGKLSDLAWMIFAPPLLAYVLSLTPLGTSQRRRAAFAAAYAGLPLLYAAFNTFQLVHDVILRALGFIGGDGPRSPLDPTDSLVIPIAMAIALWVWRRPPLDSESIRSRLAVLAAATAALATVATSYDSDWGITRVGRTDSGTLVAITRAYFPSTGFGGSYESADGGLTWAKLSEHPVLPERQGSAEWETGGSSGASFRLSDGNIIRVSGNSQEVVYSYGDLNGKGNRWQLALDNRDNQIRAISTKPHDLFYDDRSGNLIVAMGLQGVVVIGQDGPAARVAVGLYSPTNFSLSGKVNTLFSSLLAWETVVYAAVAFLLAFSFAALALAGPAPSGWARLCFALAAAGSALLAITAGVYPHVPEAPWEEDVIGGFALFFSGFGIIPFLLIAGGLPFARLTRRRALAIAAATIGMLLLIGLGALVLFETGAAIANFVAVGLVGLAALALWRWQKWLRRDVADSPADGSANAST